MGWVLFFDGACAFCARSVRWVARWDRRGRIAFAPLQGRLAGKYGLVPHATGDGATMVLLREGDERVFLRSDAFLELVRALGGRWRVLTLLRLVPRPLRDAVYQWIARHRRHLPGGADTCGLPDPELLKRLRE